MDHAHILLRTVVRAFYEVEHIVILDALIRHKALSSADVGSLFGSEKAKASGKDYLNACGRLKEAGLVSSFPRQEIKEGAHKPITKEYWFINVRYAIDAIKYKIHMLHDHVKVETSENSGRKDLSCKRCGSEYALLDVVDNIDPLGRGSGFLCRKCGAVLDNPPETEEAAAALGDRPASFNKQFRPITDLLQLIDESPIPDVTGEQAFEERVPLPRDLAPGQVKPEAEPTIFKPSAVRGLQAQAEKVETTITTASEESAKQKEEKAAEARKIQEQNQMPAWMAQSTVRMDGFAGEPSSAPVRRAAALDKGPDDSESKPEITPAFDDFYAALEKEREAQASQVPPAAAGSDEDEDEDDFEDAIPALRVSSEALVNASAKQVDLKVDQDKSLLKSENSGLLGTPGLQRTSEPGSSGSSKRARSDDDDDEDEVPLAKKSKQANGDLNGMTNGDHKPVQKQEKTEDAQLLAEKVKAESSNGEEKTQIGPADEDSDADEFEDVV
ncbi:hypothetical protein K402DRAFT_346969 [Aulographum hederae CBS 113979]|uniref:Transcription initiation factor IIE subunit alpha N-terminal domain-containing protein n=1 Tax=Aulographum hederae CBS 113979 TaxID=1176131 RepID=A0A6G1HCV9_9PEZI|nr:hypothetical protein K402DRAFT_346969 [Aulographum hederae CBS 113979]